MIRQKIETDSEGITPFYLRQIANKMELYPKQLNNPKLFRVMISSKLKDTAKYFKYDNEYDNESSMYIVDDGEIEMNFDIDKILQDILWTLS